MFILRQICHDWPDDATIKILKSVRVAMGNTKCMLALVEVMPCMPLLPPAVTCAQSVTSIVMCQRVGGPSPCQARQPFALPSQASALLWQMNATLLIQSVPWHTGRAVCSTCRFRVAIMSQPVGRATAPVARRSPRCMQRPWAKAHG